MAWTDREWIHTGRLRTATNIGMLGTLLAGCIGGLSHPVGDTNVDDVELGLAALMEDGPLPPTMQPPPAMPEVPPRFCTDPSAPPVEGVPGVSIPGSGATLPVAGATAVPVAGTTGSTPPPVPPAADGGVPVSTASSGPVTRPPTAASGMTPAPLAGTGGSSAEPTPTIDPSCAGVPIGFWTFDDCNTFRTDLTDSSFQGHTAFRSVDAACSLGQQGQAITFATKEDLVYAPDQPDFALDHGVTIAAWLKPAAVNGTQTVFRKRDDANSAIALLVNANKFQFVVRLTSGKIASVSAPAPAGTWTHVAATYDGTDLRLYLNGSEAASRHVPGVLSRGAGPLLIGNDAAGRRFEGKIDSAWFNTLAAPPDIIMQLTCLEQDPLVTLEPQVSPAVAAGTLVHYTLSVTSQNEAKCAPQSMASFVLFPDRSFTAQPEFNFFSLASGETRTFDVGIASGDETEAGTYPFSIQANLQTGNSGFPIPFFGPVGVATTTATSGTSVTVVQASGSAGSAAGDAGPASTPPSDGDTGGTRTGTVEATAQYVVAEPLGCHVTSQRELMIRDLSVVEDPVRTTFVAGDEQAGVWSFGRLMERLSRVPTDAPAVTEAMFRTFLTEQLVNTFTIQARPPMDELVLRPWPRTADGQLDLARAPLRLLTIVNRLDLKDLTKHKAGEGRFVYGVLDALGNPTEFTVIFEYALPANSEEDVRAWENAVHALQALPFPSEAYNQALQTITDRFSGHNVLPDMPNGSALIDIRTNEIVLSREGIWQLREFHISPTTGFMDPAPLFQTPDFSFNNSAVLGRFINANEATILSETHEAPLLFEGAPFQTGGVFNNIDFWDAPGITNPEARHKFSLNTCNGCHGQETQTAFLHVQPRSQGQVSTLSGFLTGETVFDQVTGAQRRLGDLKRRRQLLEAVVCAEAQP